MLQSFHCKNFLATCEHFLLRKAAFTKRHHSQPPSRRQQRRSQFIKNHDELAFKPGGYKRFFLIDHLTTLAPLTHRRTIFHNKSLKMSLLGVSKGQFHPTFLWLLPVNHTCLSLLGTTMSEPNIIFLLFESVHCSIHAALTNRFPIPSNSILLNETLKNWSPVPKFNRF